MASRGIFTKGQWGAAVGIALFLHILLAWSLIVFTPELTTSPGGQAGGLAIHSMSFGGADMPVLNDLAEPIGAVSETPVDGLLHPVAPPRVLPMTEPVPDKPKSRSANALAPKAKRRSSKSEKSAQKKREIRKSAKPPNARSASERGPASTKKESSKTGSGNAVSGLKKGRGAAGVDRGAAPAPGNPPPRYPRRARSRGEEGRVLIRVSVLGSGRVGGASISRSSGHSSLDRAALKAVKRWRFKPALRGGKPVKAILTVPVVFKLKG